MAQQPPAVYTTVCRSNGGGKLSRDLDFDADGGGRDETLPPHDTHAEESVLGAVLKRPSVVGSLIHLPPADFYNDRYRVIWRAMLDLWQRNIGIDYTSLNARLQSAEYAAAQVGVADLATIDLSVPSAANVEHYARLVMDAATQRRFIDAAQKIAEHAWRRSIDVDDLASKAESFITAARPRQSRRDLYTPERWAEAFMEDLESRATGARTAVTTGLLDLDDMTLGLEAGALYLLMATPGTGKTELAMQIGMHVGRAHGPVVFASLEMSAVELAHRYARISNGMDRNKLAKGRLDDRERVTALGVMNQMQESRFWPASPRGHYTTADLRADALEVQATAGRVSLIVADYVQRFRDRVSDRSSREENVGAVAENLKSLAREFGCPVLAPVQPNREYVSRVSKRPLLSDLRESGKLEQEADVVLGLFRDEKHNEDTEDRGVTEIHMLKNRSGVGDADGVRKIVWRSTRYDNFTTQTAPLAWATY
jgi:replicative DNA helicase